MAQDHVLVVEADPIRREALRLLLGEVGGYTVTPVASTRDALSLVARESFGLIITNTSVEDPADGIRMSRVILLRLQEAAPAIVAVTTQSDLSTILHCAETGVMDVLVHPYDPPQLLERVERVLADRQGTDKAVLKQNVK